MQEMKKAIISNSNYEFPKVEFINEPAAENTLNEEEQIEEDFNLPPGTDYSTLRTTVLIPFEPAPQDPVWLTKKYAGKKLTMEEFT